MAKPDDVKNRTLRGISKGRSLRSLWAGVPDPRAEVNALYRTVEALKQGYEQLVRSRGNPRDSAVLLGELDNFAEGIIEWVDPPVRTTSQGLAGQAARDSNYLYICVANNTWRRIALAEW